VIVVMSAKATKEQVQNVVKRLEEFGFQTHLSEGVERTIIGAIGDKTAEKVQRIEAMDGVEKTVPILQPYKLAGREFQGEKSIVEVAGVSFGGDEFPVIAGPCAVESEEQILEVARAV